MCVRCIEAEQFWAGEIPTLEEYFLIADGDIDFYCYDPTEKKYCVLLKGGLVKVEVYDNFDVMLESLVKTY